MKMAKVVLIALMVLAVRQTAPAAVVFNDDMSSLNWNEASNASNEPGPYTGGIRVLGDHVQMCSWWDNAGYTIIWRSTGVIVKDNSIYTMTVRMISYDNGHTVPFHFYNVTNGSQIVRYTPPSVSTSSYTDYSVSFSTEGTTRDYLIGHELGMTIDPGWWNNLAVTNVSITEETITPNDTTPPTPNPMTWQTPPRAANALSITMTATTATDDLSEVEYLFECTTHPEASSTWQISPIYTCYELREGQVYAFRVKAQDTSPNHNTTGFSTIASAVPVAQTYDYPPIRPGAGGNLATTHTAQLTVTIDVSDQKQTIRGFGASDCWSAQYVGLWPNAKRNKIADLLFETGLDGDSNPIGAGLSIWRTNIGAGSARQSNIHDPWRRADFYYDASLTAYDWRRCPGQRAFIQMAKARGVEHFKAFCNSPPITMTKNGYAFCDPDVGDTNLDPGKRDDFAAYLADVTAFFADFEGVEFASISPFNEPEWDWNEDSANPGRAGQEGCRYSNAEMAAFVDVLHAELQARGLQAQIDVCDSGQIDYLYSRGSFRGNHIYEFFGTSSGNYIGDRVPAAISSHSYWTDTTSYGLITMRQLLRNALDNYGLDYEQTEYCILGDYGPNRDFGIDPALYIARTIHCDMTIAQAVSWQWWLGVSPYNYKDGLVYVDKRDTDGDYYDSKMLWAVGNYARFIRPGMKRIGAVRSDNALPADSLEGLMLSSYYNASNGVIVTVLVNRTSQNKPVHFNYHNLPVDKPVNYVVPYVTSASANLTAYASLKADEAINIPSKSVVTIVSMHIAPGDFDKDLDVDFDDLMIMASEWLQTGPDLLADIAIDAGDTVNFKDFAQLAEDWSFGPSKDHADCD